MAISGDQSLMREVNRMALVRSVQRVPGSSRAELAKETGLTKSTVSLLVQDLIDEGWLQESEIQATGSIGRRPTPLFLNGTQLAMIGTEVSVESIRVLSVSLTGEVLNDASEPLRSTKPAEVIHRLAQLIHSLVEQSRVDGRRFLGIGVGVPGSVLVKQGVVKLAPHFSWRDVAFQTDLLQELATLGVNDFPIQVLNDYDLAALGEYEFGDSPLPDPLIYVGLAVGVGAGIIVRDRLFLGADGFAGEVGHSILQIEGPVCSCGRKGCAETFIGLRAISTQITGHAGELLSVETIQHLLERKDETAVLAVKRAGYFLGVLIQNLWACFNPGRIVLGGPLCNLGAPLLDAAQASLERFSEDSGLQLPEIQLARFGARSVAVGAAALVKHTLLRPLDLRLGDH